MYTNSEQQNWLVWIVTVLCLFVLMMLGGCVLPTLEWKYQYCLKHAHDYQQQNNCYREYGQAPVQFNYPPVITYPFGYAYPPSTYESTGVIVGPQGDVWIDTGAALIGPRGQTYLDLR